jgi:hypothetical protein
MVVQAAVGTSTTMLVSCALGLLYLGVRWMRARELKYFLGFATLTGLSLLVGWQGILLGTAGAVAIAVLIRTGVRQKAERRGLLWALAFPPVYVIAMWVGLNWVIMEDPLFAFRVAGRGDLIEGAFVTRGGGESVHTAGFIKGSATWLGGVASLWMPPEGASSRLQMTELRAKLDEAVPKGKIVVDGFYGYLLWYYGPGEGRLVRTLDFSGETLHGLRGPFFLVVPRPVGGAVGEDVHVKFPGIYAHEVPVTDYFVTDIGQWRIYKLMDKW